MLNSSVIRNCIDELSSIMNVNIALYDSESLLVYSTMDKQRIDGDLFRNFVESDANSQLIDETYLFKVLDDDDMVSYILTTSGDDNKAYTTGKICVSQLEMLLVAYKEKLDKNSFYQSLLMDNLLLVDVYTKAKKLHIDTTSNRVVYIVETNGEKDNMVLELLKSMFTSHNGDFVTAVDETNVIIIKALGERYTNNEIYMVAQSIVDTVGAEAMQNVRVSYGTVVPELKNVSKSYKEAMMSMDVGKIFYEERKVNAYSDLGIGRLIYQLPPTLCQVFLDEIFNDNDPTEFDEEIVSTVYKFFENNLNVSETARQMFIHRNTLVYRVEKLKNLTGLDVRVFEDALTFMIAMMVHSYLRYIKSQEQ